VLTLKLITIYAAFSICLTILVVVIKDLTHRRPKPPVNIVDGVVFPSPDDPRWERIGYNHYTLDQILVWVDSGLTSVTVMRKGYRASRYARAVVRAQREREAAEADKYVATIPKAGSNGV
jgi:hypothetical protein